MIKLVKKNRGIDVNIRDTRISKNEASCNAYLGIGKTIGCFYIESPAMHGLFRRLKCIAKMPFIPDPRYAATDEKRYAAQHQIKEDISMTHRAPYPQEINLPRFKMA